MPGRPGWKQSRAALRRELAAWDARAEALGLDPKTDGVIGCCLPLVVRWEVDRADLDFKNLVLVAGSHLRLHTRWQRLPPARQEFIRSQSLPPEDHTESLETGAAREMWSQFLRSALGARRRKPPRRGRRRARAKAADFCLGGVPSGVPPEIWGLVREFLGAAPRAAVYATSAAGARAGLARVPRAVACPSAGWNCWGSGRIEMLDAGASKLAAMVDLDVCAACAGAYVYCWDHHGWCVGECRDCYEEVLYAAYDSPSDLGRDYR